MKVFLLIILNLIFLTGMAENDANKAHKIRKTNWKIAFTNYYQNGLIVVNTGGPDILLPHRGYGFDLGFGVSRYITKHNELEFRMTWCERYTGKYIEVDYNKLADFGIKYSTFSQVLNYYSKGGNGGLDFAFNNWYHFHPKTNSWMLMYGFSFYSPNGTSHMLDYYLVERGSNTNRFLEIYYSRNEPFKPLYTVLNLGIGYEYKLWKRHNLRIALIFRYMNKIFLYGEYHTTGYANFFAKGKIYNEPGELGLNFSFKI